MNRFQVKKVAVLGAGVMGAQIAAHLVNVKVPVVLFDLADTKQDKFTIEVCLLEKLFDSLSDREKKFLLGASNAEVSAMGLTRSKYEVEKRRVRRKLAELIP